MTTTTDTERDRARLLGSLAARAERPITDCPYTKAQPLLRLWFVRGYRSVEGGKVVDTTG